MAALTSENQTRWTQPCMNATVPRLVPRAFVTAGSRRIAARAGTSGVRASITRRRGDPLYERDLRQPVEQPDAPLERHQRREARAGGRGAVKSSKTPRRTTRVDQARSV